MGSRGSIIPYFMSISNGGVLPITDFRMTRFMISLEQGVELIWQAFDSMQGGEIFVKKIPSINVTDVALAINKNARQEEVGIRPGEKLHEQMIGVEDAHYTYEYLDYFKILPAINKWASDPLRIGNGIRVKPDFVYSSETNKQWMKISELEEWIGKNRNMIGNI